jgi:hypothetical protein
MEKNKLHVVYLASAFFLLLICVFGLSMIDICGAQEGVYVQTYRADLYLDGTLDESLRLKINIECSIATGRCLSPWIAWTGLLFESYLSPHRQDAYLMSKAGRERCGSSRDWEI